MSWRLADVQLDGRRNLDHSMRGKGGPGCCCCLGQPARRGHSVIQLLFAQFAIPISSFSFKSTIPGRRRFFVHFSSVTDRES